MSSLIVASQEIDPSGATPPDDVLPSSADVVSPADADAGALPGQSFYLIAMCHFFSGFSPDEKSGDDPPAH